MLTSVERGGRARNGNDASTHTSSRTETHTKRMHMEGRAPMKGILNGVAALAAGAAAMYLLDPEMGRRRRAMLRGKLEAGRHDAGRFGRAQAERAAGQLRGAVAGIKSAVGLASVPASDEQLHERVRSQLGRIVSRPHAIDVSVEAGRVCLRGQILASEHRELVSAVEAIDDVKSVDDRLMVSAEPDSVPEPQGDGRSGS
jgi:osmotically-inducible protein OsmY